MCKLFKVSRSCYYNWLEKGSIVNKIDKPFNKLLEKIFEESRATYGTRRLKVGTCCVKKEDSKIFNSNEFKSKNETKT